MHNEYNVIIKFNGIFNSVITEYSYQSNESVKFVKKFKNYNCLIQIFFRFGIVFVNERFSSKGCRYAFPCFDTSGYSANFTLSIRHHDSIKALSNFPSTSTNFMWISFCFYIFTKLVKRSIEINEKAVNNNYSFKNSNRIFKDWTSDRIFLP